jgi:hypothetical protein
MLNKSGTKTNLSATYVGEIQVIKRSKQHHLFESDIDSENDLPLPLL